MLFVPVSGMHDRSVPLAGAGARGASVLARYSVLEEAIPEVAARRILYVNYNPATLIRDEQLLMQAGYELDTVFGTDGVMACESVADYTSILIDETCPLAERKKLICWLTDNFPKLNILSAA